MPRPRQLASSPSLSSGQASYVIDRMIGDRRISQGEIIRYVNEMQHEIDQLDGRMATRVATAGPGEEAAAEEGEGRIGFPFRLRQEVWTRMTRPREPASQDERE